MAKNLREPTARLTLVIEWDKDMNMPTINECEEIIEKAREYAAVKRATFELLSLVTKELV